MLGFLDEDVHSFRNLIFGLDGKWCHSLIPAVLGEPAQLSPSASHRLHDAGVWECFSGRKQLPPAHGDAGKSSFLMQRGNKIRKFS